MINPRNSCTLIGRIPTSDKFPIRFTEGKDGNDKADRMNVTISVKGTTKKRPEDQYKQEFLIPIVAFGGQARFIRDYVKRGDLIAIEGELQITSSRDDEGNYHSWTSVVVNAVDKVTNGDGPSGESTTQSSAAGRPTATNTPAPAATPEEQQQNLHAALGNVFNKANAAAADTKKVAGSGKLNF